jgi:hypothetical protein
VSFVFLCEETFVASLTASAHAPQRRTRRLDNVTLLIGHVMGGRLTERHARRLDVPVSLGGVPGGFKIT